MARELADGVPSGGRFAGVGLGDAGVGGPRRPDRQRRDDRLAGVSLADRFAEVGPVWVEADVRAAALAEARFGAGRPFRLFVYVSIGTGISHTLVQDGRPFAGARGNALVLASGPTSVRCPGCGAWSRTVLEEVASGPALAAAFKVRPRPRTSWRPPTAATLQRARIVRDAAEALGSSVGFLVNVLDPEAVVIGGGLGLAGGLYWNALTDAVRRHVWAETTRDLPIVPAELGTDAGMIGAAAIAAATLPGLGHSYSASRSQD